MSNQQMYQRSSCQRSKAQGKHDKSRSDFDRFTLSTATLLELACFSCFFGGIFGNV